MKKLKKNVDTQSEGQQIFKAQNEARIILNGGKMELDNATIPFTFHFSGSLLEKAPTHTLLIDFSEKEFREIDFLNFNSSSRARRTILSLTKPIHFYEFVRPGKHYLFFLFFNVSKKNFDNFSEHYLAQFNTQAYEKELFLTSFLRESIKPIDFPMDFPNGSSLAIGFLDAEVSIPKELFATEPESKIGRALFNWINRWFDKPMDECIWKRRAPIAFSIQPIIWLLGFFSRFILSVFITIIFPIMKVIFFLFGFCNKDWFAGIKSGLWTKFLFLYPRQKLESIDFYTDNYSYYKYRKFCIKGKEFVFWMAPWVLLLFLAFFAGTVFVNYLVIIPGIVDINARMLIFFAQFFFPLFFLSIGITSLKKYYSIKFFIPHISSKNDSEDKMFNLISSIYIYVLFVIYLSELVIDIYLWMDWDYFSGISTKAFTSKFFWISVNCFLLGAILFVVFTKKIPSRFLFFKIKSPFLKAKKNSFAKKVKLTKKEKARLNWQQFFNKSYGRQLPKKINKEELKKSDSFSGKILYRFRLSLMAKKAKSCRPYVRP